MLSEAPERRILAVLVDAIETCELARVYAQTKGVSITDPHEHPRLLTTVSVPSRRWDESDRLKISRAHPPGTLVEMERNDP